MDEEKDKLSVFTLNHLSNFFLELILLLRFNNDIELGIVCRKLLSNLRCYGLALGHDPVKTFLREPVGSNQVNGEDAHRPVLQQCGNYTAGGIGYDIAFH